MSDRNIQSKGLDFKGGMRATGGGRKARGTGVAVAERDQIGVHAGSAREPADAHDERYRHCEALRNVGEIRTASSPFA